MKDTLAFLGQCDTLTSGQTLPQIIYKATVLIEDEVYWCGSHKACIRWFDRLSSGEPYQREFPCRINDPNATCLNIEGAVARACNDLGILPPHLGKALDQWALDYLNHEGIQLYGDEAGIMSPYDVGWFGETYGHDMAIDLLHYIYQVLPGG